MADSIRKRISDVVLARLAGDSATPLPAACHGVKINKNRGTPVGKDEMPLYSVYFLHDPPTPIGNDHRRPVLLSRKLLIEIRIIAVGTDDSADPHVQWVSNRMATADRMIASDGTQLALGVIESETLFEPLEGNVHEVTVTKLRWFVDYKTLPDDITKVSRT